MDGAQTLCPSACLGAGPLAGRGHRGAGSRHDDGGTPGEPFVHPALIYRGDHEYVEATTRFVSDGVAAGEPVAVAVPGPRLDLIRGELGPLATDVRWIDMTRAGRNPGRIIPSVLRAFADAHRGGHVRIIGEPIWDGRTAVEYPACVQHEALINTAFGGRDVTILCPYDARALPHDVIADAHATHPVVISGDRQSVSPAYDPDGVLARCNEALRHPRERRPSASTRNSCPPPATSRRARPGNVE